MSKHGRILARIPKILKKKLEVNPSSKIKQGSKPIRLFEK